MMDDNKKDVGFVVSLDDFKKGKISEALKTESEIEKMRERSEEVLGKILGVLEKEKCQMDISATIVQIGPGVYKSVPVVKIIPK